MKLAKVTRVVESAPIKSLKQRMEEAKTAEQVNEGPFDFLRGAAGEASRRTAGAAANAGRAVKQGVGNVVQAGQAASAQADLMKAVQRLSAMLDQAYGNKAEEPAEPEQQAAPEGKPGDSVPDAFRTSSKPRGVAGKDGQDFQWTFSSYMQAIHGEQLDEGIWDFVKGAGKAAGAGIRDKINDYAEKPSVFKDIYKAGVQASTEANAERAAQAQQKLAGSIKAAVGQLQAMGAKLGPEALTAAVKKAGGQQAGRIMQMLSQQGDSGTPAAAERPSGTGGTPAGPEVRATQAGLAARRAAR